MDDRGSEFSRLSKRVARAAGQPMAFAIAAGGIVLWALSGPFFGFDDTWQLMVNTTTTIITFLMVFLIQSTQNRDTMALQIKVDELIRALEGAHLALLDLEELEENELERFRGRYRELAEHGREALRRGGDDTGREEVDVSDEVEGAG